MNVDDKLIDKLANLAKLQFDSSAKYKMREDLSRMFDFVDKLNEVDTEGIEPLVFVSDDKNVFREDEIKIVISQEEALKNAP